MINEYLKLQWAKTSNGETIGDFWDANGGNCTIMRARFHKDQRSIIIVCGHGSLVLDPEMCAELGLVLGYIAFTDGQLPEPAHD